LVFSGLAVIFITSLVIWRRGYRPARYFVLAQTVLLGTFFTGLLAQLGYAPLFFAEYIPMFALSLMAVLMSLALADRINIIKQELELAEAETRQRNRELTKYREHLEVLVKERTTELEAANNKLEAFAYSVSHDLRAPLRHIGGFIELLQKRADTAFNKQCRHYMDNISDSSQKMERLIDGLLSFSRMGRQELYRTQVDLNILVQDIIRKLESETKGRTIDWHIKDLPVVSADPTLIRAVLVNLISNAIKFTRPRERAEIEIGHHNQQTESVIFVRDNGVGFDMKYTDKLFGVFQRLHHADEFEGTGIGLANVRLIIERHGGKVWAEGIIDNGAVFYFSLPILD
jgi:light-regulated signal transduction histidine kinase (bacteriophytochrome)